MKKAAGTLLYRSGPTGWEVLLVHPSGDYNRHKPWSIPKGLPEPGEDMETTARRETQEEAGVTAGPLVLLAAIDYTKSRKRVFAFAGPAPPEAPQCASWEVDRAEYLSLPEARRVIHPDQAAFLDRLEEMLASGSQGAATTS